MTDESDDNRLEAHECRGDFWVVLSDAIEQAGGDPDSIEELADLSFEEVVHILAPNGIRMVFIHDAHISERRQA